MRLHDSSLIHGFFFFLRLIPRPLDMPASSPESLVPLLHLLLPLFPLSPRLLQAILNLLNTSSFLDLVVSYLTLHLFFSVVCLLSLVLVFVLSTVHTRWWSLPIPAYLYTLGSFADFLNRLLIITWSIWFMLFTWEIHVTLWMVLCGKKCSCYN